MGVHKNNSMENFIRFFLSTDKKFIHMKKTSERASGYRIGFLHSVHPYEKASYQHNT